MAEHPYKTDEEQRLWETYFAARASASPLTEARNALIEHYLPAVRSVAGKYVKKHHMCHGFWSFSTVRAPGQNNSRAPAGADRTIDYGDLVNEGMFGLMRAVAKYDPALGFHFWSFAAPSVLGAILDFMRRVDWVPRLERSRLRRTGGEPVKVQSLNYNMNHSDVNTPRGTSMEDLVAEIVPNDTALVREDFRNWICKGLNDVERQIIVLYYYKHTTMKAIGVVLGLSESRVSQLHDQIIARMKERLTDHYADRYPDEFAAVIS